MRISSGGEGWGGEIAERRAKILAHSIKLEDNDPFGRVILGSITIRGNFLPSKNWGGAARPYYQSFRVAQRSHLSFLNNPNERNQIICSFDVDEEIDSDTRFQGTFLLQIASWKRGEQMAASLALLLVPAEAETSETYRRVGIAEIPHIHGLEEDKWETKNVCII